VCATLIVRAKRAIVSSVPSLCAQCVAACIVAACCPAVARAGDDQARADLADGPWTRPFMRHPIAFFSLSAGVGGFSAGSTTDAGHDAHGYGGPRGTLAVRGDLQAVSPLWLSLSGRTFGVKPAEAEVDASVGYEFRFRWLDAPQRQRERLQLRLLAGIKAVRFADSPDTPTTARATAIRAGLDWALDGEESIRGFNAWRAHVVGLWDVARRQPGFELETTAGVVFPGALDGGFLGIDLGALPATGGFFVLEVGATWEVGAGPTS
jgi:hypothetical protein